MQLVEEKLSAKIIEIGHFLYRHGYIVANDGNISTRTPDGNILITPAGVNKGFLTADMIVKTTLSGNQIEGTYKPSSELGMHLVIYEERSDIQAIVHAHPLVSTGFAATRRSLETPLISEVVIALGSVPLAEYGTPSTNELFETIRPLCKKHDAILLANHGAVTYGSDLEMAYSRMETLEHFARISLVAHLLGGGYPIPTQMVDKLVKIREKTNLTTSKPHESNSFAPQNNLDFEDELITLTRKELVDLIAEVTQATLKKYNLT